MTATTPSDSLETDDRPALVAVVLLAAAELIFAAALVGVAIVMRAGDSTRFDAQTWLIAEDARFLLAPPAILLLAIALPGLVKPVREKSLWVVAFSTIAIGAGCLVGLFALGMMAGLRENAVAPQACALALLVAAPLSIQSVVAGGLCVVSLERVDLRLATILIGLMSGTGGFALWLLATAFAGTGEFDPLPIGG